MSLGSRSSLLTASLFSYLAAFACFVFFWIRNGYWPDLGAAIIFFVCGCVSEAVLEMYQKLK